MLSIKFNWITFIYKWILYANIKRVLLWISIHHHSIFCICKSRKYHWPSESCESTFICCFGLHSTQHLIFQYKTSNWIRRIQNDTIHPIIIDMFAMQCTHILLLSLHLSILYILNCGLFNSQFRTFFYKKKEKISPIATRKLCNLLIRVNQVPAFIQIFWF